MAVTPASAGNANTVASATATKCFPGTDGIDACATILIQVDSGSAAALQVSVTSVHTTATDGTGTYFSMAAGTEQAFRAGIDDITAVYVKGNGDTATFNWSVISKGAR